MEPKLPPSAKEIHRRRGSATANGGARMTEDGHTEATHFLELFDKYKGRVDRDGRFSHFTRKIDLDGKQQINPLFGVESFLTMTMIWTRTRVVRVLPSDLLRRVDCLDTPRGFGAMQPPNLKSPRNWLKLAPVANQRSNYITLVERWMASGRNGFNVDIYTEKGTAG